LFDTSTDVSPAYQVAIPGVAFESLILRKLTSIVFVIAVFASACASAWTPSAAEVALSAKEDARDLVLFKLLTK
jgi:hypothetical protein